MADNNIDLTINVDNSDATKAMNNFGKSAKSAANEAASGFNKVEKSLDGFGSKLKTIGTAIVGYFSVKAIGGFFSTIIEESVDAENNMNQLSAALARTGNNTQKMTDDLSNFASEMMKVSTVDDDVITGQLAMALNFTQSTEQAKKLVKASMDLSAAMGIDLNTATDYLGKSLDGTAGRLNELVPELKGVTEESLKAGSAIDIVAAKFGGSATSKLQTFSGSVEQLKNNLGNFYAAMGDAITRNPMVIAAVNELSKGLSKITGSIAGSTDNVQDFINRGLIYLLDGIKAILPSLDKFIIFLKAIVFQFEFLYKMALNAYEGLKIVANGIAYLAGDKNALKDIELSMKTMNERADSLAESFVKIGESVIDPKDLDSISAAIDRVKKAASTKPVKLNVEVDAKAAVKLQEQFKKEKLTIYDEDAFANEFERLKFIVNSTLKDIGEAIASKIQGAGEAINKLANVALSSVISNISGGESGARSAIVDTAGALGGLVDKISGTGNFFADAIKGLLNALKDPNTLKDMIRGFIDAIPSIIDSFINALPTLIQGIVDALPVLFDGIIRLVPVLFKELAKGLPQILITLADAIPDLIIAIAENLPVIIEAIADKLDVIVEKLISKIPNIAVALVKAVIRAVISIITKAIPNIISGLLKGVANWFKSGPVFDGVKSIGDFFKSIPTTLSEGVSSIGTFFTEIPMKMAEGFNQVISFFKQIPSLLWDSIVKLSEFFYITIPMKLWEGVLALWEFIKTIPNMIADAFQSVWDFIKTIPNLFVDALKNVWEFFKGIGSFLQSALDSVFNFFKDIPGKIGDAISDLFNFFRDLPGKLWDEIKGAFSGGGKGGNVFQQVGGAISGGFKSVTSALGFAEGGVVPGGYPNDTYPALLTSGETVVRSETTGNLFRLIDNLANEDRNLNLSETNQLLRQLINIMAAKETTIDVKLERDTLARAILSLNKDNRRLA